MQQFSSKLGFVSFLKYSPDGESETSRRLRTVRDGVKNDGHIEQLRIIDFVAKRLAEERGNFPCLAEILSADVTLVPIPRSSPLKEGALWPARRICESFMAAGLCLDVRPLLERISPVRVSHLAASGERPEPRDHYSSVQMSSELSLSSPKRILLVDDVVTRGATLMGISTRVAEAVPSATIPCFAVLRPLRGEIDEILEPVKGEITYQNGTLVRSP